MTKKADLDKLEALIIENGMYRWWPKEVTQLIEGHSLEVESFTKAMLKERRYLWYTEELFALIDRKRKYAH